MAKLDSYEMGKRIRALIAELAPEGTTFAWDSAERRFGKCHYSRNRITGKWYRFEISISYPLAIRNDWEVVKNTVLHEIAHANTPGHGHDAVWRRECIRIGGDGQRCYNSVDHGGPVVTLAPKYIGICPICGQKFPRQRRTDGWCPCVGERNWTTHNKINWTVNR